MTKTKCDRCGGEGTVTVNLNFGATDKDIPCYVCDGTGEVSG